MALDWRNDNTIRWLLQGNVTKVFRQLQADAAPHGGIAMGDDVEAVRRDATELRDQILAGAEPGEAVDDYTVRLSSVIEQIVTNMGSVAAKYDAEYVIGTEDVKMFFNAVEAIQRDSGDMLKTLTTLQGEIRLGIIQVPDPDHPGSYTDETGIAIGQKLQFTGETVVDGDATYYRLAQGQTFAFYTSTGWQYWIRGNKVGWYDSSDGMLHVVQIQSEGDIQFGKDPNKWLITEDSGWGIRYLGG